MEQLTREMNQISAQVEQLFQGYDFKMEELFQLLLQGKITDVTKMLFQNMAQAFSGEVGSYVEMLAMLLSVGILSALLMNLTDLFKNKQIGDLSFYFIYLFLILVLIQVFEMIVGTAGNLMSDMLLLLKLMMPIYFIAVGAAAGVTTALVYHQCVLGLIFVIELSLDKILLPVIQAYVFLAFMNGLWKDERLQMLLKLIRQLIGYILKLSLAIITGISLIQSMITPVMNSVKMSAMQKAVGMIPGVGNISSSAAEMVIGSAVLIKNSAGVLVIILLLALCALPLIKIWFLSFTLKVAAALSSMVSDKRLVSCMDTVGEGGLMVFRTLLTFCALFLIMTAIAALTTNRGF